MKRKCAHTSCITLLGSFNNGRYCFTHSKPTYRWSDAGNFFEGLREEGIPPRGNVNCECGRIRKSSTSCVCKATPAPRKEWWAA